MQDVLTPFMLQEACRDFKPEQMAAFLSGLLKKADAAWQEKTQRVKRHCGDNITASVAHIIVMQ
jgi:hypothetical protein